jgi:hypothetical protein
MPSGGQAVARDDSLPSGSRGIKELSCENRGVPCAERAVVGITPVRSKSQLQHKTMLGRKTMAQKIDTRVNPNPAQHKSLKDYEAVVGQSLDSTVHEALSDFIECCVSTRLECYQRRIHHA